MNINFLNFFNRKKPRIERVEIKIYEVDCEQSAKHFFRLQLENEALKQQLRQCENDFEIRVGLEVCLKTQLILEENQALRAELAAVKAQQKP